MNAAEIEIYAMDLKRKQASYKEICDPDFNIRLGYQTNHGVGTAHELQSLLDEPEFLRDVTDQLRARVGHHIAKLEDKLRRLVNDDAV